MITNGNTTRTRVKNTLKLALLVLCLIAAAGALAQQPAATTASSQAQKVEAFLRYYFALGPEVELTVGTPTELGTSGLLEVPIAVKSKEGSDNLKMYLTKDGRYLLRGDISDLTTDPLAENIAKIQTANAPVLGDPNAPITLVLYSDFECPGCRSFHDAIRGLLPNYPQVKLIFKDFPIDAIHPWARTAALAGRCAYQQNPKAFWKIYDLLYDNQDLISAASVWDKMLDLAARAGLNIDTFKSCMVSPQAAADIDASLANGQLLEVRVTPTAFINGRRISGADAHTVQQYIDFEVAKIKAGKATPKK